MPPLVVVKDLVRRFGARIAVENLTFEVEEGTVLGLIGPNGAGKSTTLKMLATLLRPNNGDATIMGHSIKGAPELVRRVIGYMPDVCGLYEDMLVHEYLRFFASIYGIKGAAAESAISSVLAVARLESHANDTCGALSRGMSQRLHVARVIIHDPKLLLLDEPASGLDPRARIDFREIVHSLKAMGKTLIISSHILSELGEMCDSIAIIEKSRLVYIGPVDAATASVREGGKLLRIRVKEAPEADRTRADVIELVRGLPSVEAVREGDREGEFLVRLKAGETSFSGINQEIVRRGYGVEHFAEEEVRLEDAFLHLTKDVAP